MGIFDNNFFNEEELAPKKPVNFNGKLPHIKRWEKEEIVKLIELWPNHTIEEISQILNRPTGGIQRLTAAIRKMGVKLERKKYKHTNPGLKAIIREVLTELNLIK